MDLTVAAYVAYLLLSVPLTIWVARTLFRNGRLFLLDVFDGAAELADAVNRLLVVGFYLLNLGFVLLYLRMADAVVSGRDLVETLSAKLGVVTLVIGGMHLLNVYVFNRVRRRRLLDVAPRPPLAPSAWTVPPRGGPGPGPAAQFPSHPA
jgi:hypothetical protein